MAQVIHSHWFYSAVLAAAWSSLLVVDWHWRLVWWRYPKAALLCMAALLPLFVIWDIAGIAGGVFFTNQHLVLGWHIVSPNFPLEELVFLGLLIDSSLVLYRLLEPKP